MAPKKNETEATAQELDAIRSLKRQLIGEIRDQNPFAKNEEPNESKTKDYQLSIKRYRDLIALEDTVWERISSAAQREDS